MRTIDLHAHLMPRSCWSALSQGQEWYGYRLEPGGEGLGAIVSQQERGGIPSPKLRYTPEERVEDMDQMGVNVHVVSIHVPFMGYHLDASQGLSLAREVNDEIASMVRQWPQRFSGLATLPMQDVGAAIGELERAVHTLGIKGAELRTEVNGHMWDEPAFFPLFRAAEEMGALLFFHPHPQVNIATLRSDRYTLGNILGTMGEDVLTVAALIFGGVLDRFPSLRVLIAHGGGPACFGMGRMDRGWRARPEARVNISHPPSHYHSKIYYDCLTQNEASLRFLIDQVGIDHVVLGSDWPFVSGSIVEWVQGLASLTEAEKESILWRNAEPLLGI